MVVSVYLLLIEIRKDMAEISKTVAELHAKAVEKYSTEKNDFSDFPVFSKVKIIAPFVDFVFFYGETGMVIKNSRDYLGITVKLDEPRRNIIEWNFNPKDLFKIGIVTRFELMDMEE